MPDSEGKLSDSEKQVIADNILKWPDDNGRDCCPICKQSDWSVGDYLIRSDVFVPSKVVLGGLSVPMALVWCKNCHYTRTFLAAPLGLLSDVRVDEAEGDR